MIQARFRIPSLLTGVGQRGDADRTITREQIDRGHGAIAEDSFAGTIRQGRHRRCDHVAMGFFRRGYDRFQANPSSLRYATAAIISLTVAVVLLGALMMWIFDHNQYPTYGGALWFTLQTVTTVGYGDTTPTSAVGRSVAAVVMLTAIGLVTVLTARVTSTFIEAARIRTTQSQAAAASHEADPFAQLDATLVDRLDQIESTLAERLDQIESTLAERLDQIESTLVADGSATSE